MKRVLLCTAFCDIFLAMTITQTVEITADRRITLEVPSEVPLGRAIIAFIPATQEANAADSSPKKKMTEAEEIEYINRNAEYLNKEAMDVILDQDLDGFEEDLKRLSPQELKVLRDTTVPFNLADLMRPE